MMDELIDFINEKYCIKIKINNIKCQMVNILSQRVSIRVFNIKLNVLIFHLNFHKLI